MNKPAQSWLMLKRDYDARWGWPKRLPFTSDTRLRPLPFRAAKASQVGFLIRGRQRDARPGSGRNRYQQSKIREKLSPESLLHWAMRAKLYRMWGLSPQTSLQ